LLPPPCYNKYMSIAGNQYADKIFSEHPIALWSLDEDVYYLSLIDDNARLFSNWTLTNCTSNNSPTVTVPSPFNDDIYSSLLANTSSPVLIKAESPDLFSSTNISTNIDTFCVNFFMYQKPDYINWFKVGYKYTDGSSVTHEVLSDEIPPPSSASWANLNNVYSFPTGWVGSIRLIIEISFKNSSGGDSSSRTLIMNGLSVGQGSETTCYESLGNQQINLPEEIGFSGLNAIPADQYGVLSDNGYYIVRDNDLLANNNGFPIVYGTNQSTTIYPSNANLPSVVFPGKGILNESGRNKQYTLEIWMRIDPSTSTARKIIGPVSSNDGVYVKEGFITLVVGNEIGSHCVSEWYRPMLMHLVMKENNILMLINGEQVIDIPLNRVSIDLPNDRDWWGIYSYDSINLFQIDCISIFPYTISNSIAKRRFVYGQGTPSIQSIDNGFLGTPTTIDFATAEYNANIVYPDIARWDAGYFNNLNATKDYLSVPNYALPIINLGGRDLQEWYADNYTVNTLEYPSGNHANFITFRPNINYDGSGIATSWDQTTQTHAGTNYENECYLNFPSLNILNNPIAAVYGIFEAEQNITRDRILMSFVNITNGQTFDVKINSDEVEYSINGRHLYTEIIDVGTEFMVGLNFEQAGIQFGYDVSTFFSSPASIQLYVGGNGSETFEGKIYNIGFANQSNYEKISTYYLSNGIAAQENYELFLNHIASYTLVTEYEYGKLFLDISVSSEWEEYYPLSYFASYVKDEDGNPKYDLDMLQVNLGYSTTEAQGVWTYQQLHDQFSTSNYAGLRDSIYSTYFNLYKNNTTGDTINVSNSSLQGYVTFQSLASGANKPLNSFSYEKQLGLNSVIDADAENTIAVPEKAYDTKFVFKDNVIIYPPKSKNFEDYAAVFHLGINQRSILKNPLKIKSFEITSKNLNYVSNSSNEAQRSYIGTKFGTRIYPQIYDEGTVDYKSKNPLFIYKTGTPYLYNTKKSGINVVNTTTVSPTQSESIASIPVNKSGSYNFNVGAMQFMLFGKFSSTIEQIYLMDIKDKSGTISLVLDKTNTGNVIKAYRKNGSTLTPETTINFYQNGKYVLSPTIKNGEWNAIGMSFADQLDFSQYKDGSIDLFGGFMFNNISYYLAEGMGIKTNLTVRSWENVLNYESTARLWSFWSADSKTWQDVYIVGQASSYVSTPADIYSVYTGTNRSVIDDNHGISFGETQLSVITDVSWQTATYKPV
jgi:hypothetical protein